MWDMIDRYKPTLKTISEMNYINYFKRNNKYKYVMVSKGLCIFDNKKIHTTRYSIKNNYVYKSQCDKKARQEIAHSYTFTNRATATKKKFKYNCLIHRINRITDVEKIKGSITINNNKYKDSQCFILKY